VRMSQGCYEETGYVEIQLREAVFFVVS